MEDGELQAASSAIYSLESFGVRGKLFGTPGCSLLFNCEVTSFSTKKLLLLKRGQVLLCFGLAHRFGGNLNLPFHFGSLYATEINFLPWISQRLSFVLKQ